MYNPSTENKLIVERLFELKARLATFGIQFYSGQPINVIKSNEHG